jgi:hypothetical protein
MHTCHDHPQINPRRQEISKRLPVPQLQMHAVLSEEAAISAKYFFQRDYSILFIVDTVIAD